METVKAYKTSDNKVFQNLEDAHAHEFKIKIQGFFNTRGRTSVNNLIAVPDVAHVIANDLDEMINLLVQRRKTVKRLANPRPYKPRKPKMLTTGIVNAQVATKNVSVASP